MATVDDLLANPGTYLGIDQAVGHDDRAVAKIVVTPLPGGAGVTLDYETFNPAHPDRVQGHREHTIIAKAHGGGTIMVIGHTHGEVVAVLHEGEPGVFDLGPEGSPFPMRVRVEVPAPGRLRHVWSYGRPGEEPEERDLAEVELAR
jgi:hypothetical protein